MLRIWDFIRSKSNRDRLAWLGGGGVVVVAGIWTAFVYFFPQAKPPQNSGNTTANCGSVAFTGNVTGSTIVAGQGTSAACNTK